MARGQYGPHVEDAGAVARLMQVALRMGGPSQLFEPIADLWSDLHRLGPLLVTLEAARLCLKTLPPVAAYEQIVFSDCTRHELERAVEARWSELRPHLDTILATVVTQ